MSDTSQYRAALAQKLADLAGLGEMTERQQRSLNVTAKQRMAAIESELTPLRVKALLSNESAGRYRALIHERARLQVMLLRGK